MFRLIVGLGNPGRAFQGTRHNLGAWAVESIASYYGLAWQAVDRFQAQIAQWPLPEAGGELVLLRPKVYMNCSGVAVGAWCRYSQLAPEEIVILHDELDLPLGQLQSQIGGGLNGHNGLRSVASALGGRTDFARLRLGIGRPPPTQKVADFVLARFTAAQRQVWQEQLAQLPPLVLRWLTAADSTSLALPPVAS